MAVRRQMRMRRRRRRRRILLVGGMIAVGYAGYKMSKKDVERVEEHTGQSADELTDEQLEQAMEQLGIEQETMSDEEFAAAEKADAEPSYLDELERLGALRDQGINPAGTWIPFSFRYLTVPGCSGMGEYLTAFSAVV